MRPSRPPRLILVDGFAGSGKSTTAQRLCLQARAEGHRAVWFHENEAANPIFRYGEVEDLLDLTPETFEDRILANWAAFARNDDAETIRILEGAFFQLTVGVMLSLNVRASRILRTLREIDRLIGPLGPALIHLFYRDTRRGLLGIGEHRGAYWLTGMTTIVGQSRYGRRHRVRDVEGLVGFYQAQQAILDAVRPALTLRRLDIEISRGAWQAYATRMSRFLTLPANGASPAWPLRRLRPYLGRYRTTAGRGAFVTTDGASLYLQEAQEPAQRLLPSGAGVFSVESLPIDVRFGAPTRGACRRLTIVNRLVTAPAARSTFTRIEERPPSR